MRITGDEVKAWEQLLLVEPVATELTLRVGIVPESEHLQFQLEMTDASSGELLALQSWPHVPFHRGELAFAEVCSAVAHLVRERTAPF